MTEAALALSEEKLHSLGDLQSKTKEEQARLVESHAKEIQQLKKVGLPWLGRKMEYTYIL